MLIRRQSFRPRDYNGPNFNIIHADIWWVQFPPHLDLFHSPCQCPRKTTLISAESTSRRAFNKNSKNFSRFRLLSTKLASVLSCPSKHSSPQSFLDSMLLVFQRTCTAAFFEMSRQPPMQFNWRSVPFRPFHFRGSWPVLSGRPGPKVS